MLIFSIIGRDLIIILRYYTSASYISLFTKDYYIYMITFITYCHVLFLSISLIYLYPLSEMVFSPNETRANETCIEQASKYNKQLSGINYRTRTFELRPGEHRRGGGHRQGWLSTIPATCHKLSHWPYMALATDSARVTFALRNLNSDAETILIFDTRETAGQDGSLI